LEDHTTPNLYRELAKARKNENVTGTVVIEIQKRDHDTNNRRTTTTEQEPQRRRQQQKIKDDTRTRAARRRSRRFKEKPRERVTNLGGRSNL
jgi:hypothetical protein